MLDKQYNDKVLLQKEGITILCSSIGPIWLNIIWYKIWFRYNNILVKTRPSILCVTHQMRRKKGKDPVGSTLRYEMLNHKVIPIGTWWYLVSIQRYWLVLGSTRSVWAGTAWHLVVQGQYMAVLVGTGWYLVVLGQYRAVLVDTCWNLVSMGLILVGTWR